MRLNGVRYGNSDEINQLFQFVRGLAKRTIEYYYPKLTDSEQKELKAIIQKLCYPST